eukprot:IDg23887t1
MNFGIALLPDAAITALPARIYDTRAKFVYVRRGRVPLLSVFSPRPPRGTRMSRARSAPSGPRGPRARGERGGSGSNSTLSFDAPTGSTAPAMKRACMSAVRIYVVHGRIENCDGSALVWCAKSMIWANTNSSVGGSV